MGGLQCRKEKPELATVTAKGLGLFLTVFVAKVQFLKMTCSSISNYSEYDLFYHYATLMYLSADKAEL